MSANLDLTARNALRRSSQKLDDARHADERHDAGKFARPRRRRAGRRLSRAMRAATATSTIASKRPASIAAPPARLGRRSAPMCAFAPQPPKRRRQVFVPAVAVGRMRRRSRSRTRQKIARACRMIEAAEAPPTLAQLARTVGLSPYHFHRLFSRIAGVTPKAYAQAHRRARLHERTEGKPHSDRCDL